MAMAKLHKSTQAVLMTVIVLYIFASPSRGWFCVYVNCKTDRRWPVTKGEVEERDWNYQSKYFDLDRLSLRGKK